MIQNEKISKILADISNLSHSERRKLLLYMVAFPEIEDVDVLRLLELHVQGVSKYLPGIVSTPGVCGGSACIVRTRIPVWTLERMRQLGIPESDILRSYPTLYANDLVQAWAYVGEHQAEIERDIVRNEEEESGPAGRVLEL